MRGLVGAVLLAAMVLGGCVDPPGGAPPATSTDEPLAPVVPANLPPVVSATASPTSTDRRTPVEFHGEASDPDGAIVSWRWDFGDGQESSGPNATHLYTTLGAMVATLTVTDDDGAKASATVAVEVLNLPPRAVMEVRPDEFAVGEPLRFFSLSSDDDGYVVWWRWLFGDGTTSTEAAPVHTYERFDRYTVRLVVRDNEGAETTAAKLIQFAPSMTIVSFTAEKGACGDPIPFVVRLSNGGVVARGVNVSLWAHAEGEPLPRLSFSQRIDDLASGERRIVEGTLTLADRCDVVDKYWVRVDVFPANGGGTNRAWPLEL